MHLYQVKITGLRYIEKSFTVEIEDGDDPTLAAWEEAVDQDWISGDIESVRIESLVKID